MPESIAAFTLSACAWVISPAATAASTCFFSAFLSAVESASGLTPSWFAASVTTAALRSLGEPSSVAAIAAPPPATARAAIPPATIFLFMPCGSFRQQPELRVEVSFGRVPSVSEAVFVLPERS